MRKLWIGTAVLALAAGAGAWLVLGSTPVWTTDSEAALEEFERGLEAEMKYYHGDAQEHYQRALELDPHFAMARLRLLLESHERGERKQLLEKLRATDLARLTPRERFLVEYHLAAADDRDEERAELLERFLDAHPDDSFALAIYAEEAWREQDWDRATELYRRLLEADPNWVQARNRLGYIAMAQGRFDDAEELFKTYKYVAPDQANPHDSLGELLTLVGRYEEARQELEEALRIRPDFCASYENLMKQAILQGQGDELAAVAARAREHCDPGDLEGLTCEVFLWQAFFSGDFDAPWEDDSLGCLERHEKGSPNYLIHRMAVLSGRRSSAIEDEARFRREIEEHEAEHGHTMELARAQLLNMEGSRLAMEGRYSEAIERLRQADKAIYFWGRGGGVLKLYNLLNLAYALDKNGDAEASQAVLERVRKVNPAFARVFDELEMQPRPTPPR